MKHKKWLCNLMLGTVGVLVAWLQFEFLDSKEGPELVLSRLPGGGHSSGAVSVQERKTNVNSTKNAAPSQSKNEYWDFLNSNPQIASRIRFSPIRPTLELDSMGLDVFEMKEFSPRLKSALTKIQERMVRRVNESVKTLHKDDHSLILTVPKRRESDEEKLALADISEAFGGNDSAQKVFLSRAYETLKRATGEFGSRSQVYFIKPVTEAEIPFSNPGDNYFISSGYIDDASDANVLKAFKSTTPDQLGFEVLDQHSIKEIPVSNNPLSLR